MQNSGVSHKHRHIRILAAPALAGLTLVLAFAQAATANPTLVVDANTGSVISENESTKPWHPASTTKLMTVYIALKMVKEGKVKLDTPLVGTKRAAAQKPSKIGIRPGQIITLDNALKILLVKSANDIAYVIGEGLGGTAENFVARMNQEAHQLGMRESYFTNPNGWHDSRQQTSARDLAILARALLSEFPDFQDYWGIGSVQLGSKVYKNTNGLIGRYPGALGMKTGFVCASGFNVVALANRGGRTLITVVLGAPTSSQRTLTAAQLFDKGFNASSSGPTLAQLPGSGERSASSIRSQVCGGKRGIPPTDEDFDGAIVSSQAGTPSADTDSIYATIREQQGSSPAAGSRVASSARYALGERNLGAPIAVYLGRAPGSTEPVFGGKVIAAAATAGLATFGQPEKAPKSGKAPAAARPQPIEPEATSGSEDLSEPLPLQGASAAKAARTPRASDAASIRQGGGKAQGKKLGAITPREASSTSPRTPSKSGPKSSDVKGAKTGEKTVSGTKTTGKTTKLIRPEPVAPKSSLKNKAASAPKLKLPAAEE